MFTTSSVPVAVYCDGGVVGKNPSDLGGTWAWASVDEEGLLVGWASGYVTPEQTGRRVTNNYTELLAAVLAMEALPTGFRGMIWTDSFVTLCRITSSDAFANIPRELEDRTRAERQRHRTGKQKHRGSKQAANNFHEPLPYYLQARLLGGHPSPDDLARGHRVDWTPVSEWNVWCDQECRRQAGLLRATLAVV